MKKMQQIALAALLSLVTAGVQADDDQIRAKAKLIDASGEAVGEVLLRQGPNGTLFNLELQGLPPGMKAMHIHSIGNCEDHHHGFKDSSGHLNPDGKKHGLMNPKGPDAGDLTNFYVHSDGYARAEFFNERASLDGSVGAQILDDSGAALVIHESPDDHVGQPIGGAGARIACGVIEGL